jgi:cellulose synthase/poly-beta-1,6-N-acetylglucosamine synthase-like glycosyltransferase
MIVFYGLIALIVLIFFGIQLFSLVIIWMYKPKPFQPVTVFPKVSILLAARNEEQLILRNLEAIEQLNYPKDKLEVLIGNDASTDKTSILIEQFIQDKSNYQLFQITEVLGKGRGKANVLAQLAHKATGEFYFITDVDVKLPTNWIQQMLQGFKPEVGLVSGTTMCQTGSLFATLQGIDWLHFMGYIKAFAQVKVGCTSVGNNMAVRAEAYWQTGGYEAIDFSITEDYKLFKEVTSRGWKWNTQLNEDTLGLAWYIPHIKEMLHQRKRWLIGAQELPLNWKFMIVLYGLFYPALLSLLLLNWKLGCIIWIIKFLLQNLFIDALCRKVKRSTFNLYHSLVYEIYLVLNTIASAVFYFLPLKSVWKGREYSAAYIGDAKKKK